MRRRFRQLLDWLHWPELRREPPPRAAIVIVVVGILACGVAAGVAHIKTTGEAAHLEWVKKIAIPDSKAVEVPGGEQKMKLTEGLIRSTGTNVSGHALYQVAEVLQFEAEAPIGQARILCSIAAPNGVEIGQTSGGLRALYPRSSEGGIYKQEVPETVLIDFASHGHEFAVLEVGDLPRKWTTERGVKLEWPEYELGTEHLKYFIAGGKPKNVLRLPFNSVWNATEKVPAANISCTVKTSAGTATVSTKGAMKEEAPPIDEEAEEAAQEQRQEETAAEEEENDEAGGEGE